MTAAQVAAQTQAPETEPCPAMDKWLLLRAVTAARKTLGLGDRDLAVLTALLSCYPARVLTPARGLVVWPSNATLQARAHGMAESTLRRHLATLVAAGLIRRQDSPNGKRYATRARNGVPGMVFGFDLAPLLARAEEIARAAAAEAAMAETLREARTACSLMLRDLDKLAALRIAEGFGLPTGFDGDLAELRRALRRKLSAPALSALQARMAAALALLHHPETSHPGGFDSENERHQQSPETDCPVRRSEALTLAEVLERAPDIADYAMNGVQTWDELVDTATRLAPMIGIRPETWGAACRQMGRVMAAAVVAAMMHNLDRIAHPDPWLASLILRHRDGRFGFAALFPKAPRRTKL